jgi:hypothetical protein
MKLTDADADLYFELMWALQWYANQKFRLLSGASGLTIAEYSNLPSEDKVKVRDQLFKQLDIIDAFVQENPCKLSTEQLAIVQSWKHLVSGKFYIERFLKKYAIFISEDRRKVYGVFALRDAFDEMMHRSQLPLLVETTLLPFKGIIIYDGLLRWYSIYFGRGISGDLKEAYMAAKQNGTIIESLDRPAQAAPQPAKQLPDTDLSSEIEALLKQAKKLKGGADQPAIYSPIFKLIRNSLELAQTATGNPEDFDALRKGLNKAANTIRNIDKTLDRAEFY